MRMKDEMGAETFDITQTDAAAKSGQRREKRSRVLLAAKLQTRLGDIDARLRDLSRKGALLECTGRLDIDDEVVFVRGATSVAARVAWTGGSRVGIEFHEMIDESELLVHVNRGPVTPNQQRFRRPRLLSEDLTEQERKLAQLWGAAVGISVAVD